ncbi:MULTISPECIES: TRAP transporter substrate-binding protein [unclassified Prochlorococcus]|uniref:TRAP transporter substrate-binding protein n=1 Tax=unclassified Prochlorococcus TaxID=2627481 RepID=UPI0005339047|nr:MULTISPECIES: TRAP transporter substrate-binding protein [unclassified Prochlorococcus]KGG25317.1 TRAP transporter solute receptor [Prochlorococcus sp. MIT 0701]KGG26347.1 TRAP transporter solute receptor [Prochlorococcus sp. MIT 0702]KGG31234.1 TRAP transporter solute receptor [Prochlorococcus sp. MIT 0703]
MQRRKLLGSGATAVSAAVGAGILSACTIRREEESGSKSSQPKVRWRMATSWPPSLDTIYGGAETISQRVNELSGGNFQIKPYAAGELVPGLEVLDAVQAGSVECGHTASYYYIGKNPSFAFGTSVPFGLSAQQQNAWLYEAGGNEAINNLYADFGVISFPAGNTGAQMGGWFKRKLEGLSSLQGLKMRIPGLGGKVLASLGVNVQVLPGGEIYLALERGAIDAAEWTGPYDDEKLGLAKAARFYYYPGWWEPGPTLTALVNQQAWSKLPSEYQAMFSTACYEANLTMLSRYDTLNGAALQRLLKGNTELVPYDQSILKAAQEAAFQLYSDTAAKDASFRNLLQQWQGFRKEVYAWNNVNEFSFARFSYDQLKGS